MKSTLQVFVVRWFLNSFLLWIFVEAFGRVKLGAGAGIFFFAGLVFSVLNATLRPFLKILALPITVLTLGIFTLFVNGFVLWLAVKIAPNMTMGFGASVVAGIVVSSINYLMTDYFKEKEI